MDIETYLSQKRSRVDSFLASFYSSPVAPKVLQDAIVYSLTAGGKRIRPVLCLASHEACGGAAADIMPCAAAIELIHTYSLIHDDLPAMDNDDLRRGKPTNHKVFGEGMAILAGDALLTDAFRLIADFALRSGQRFRAAEPSNGGGTSAAGGSGDDVFLKVIRELSSAAGSRGMVAGQAQDLLSEDAEPDPLTLSFIHTHKTAALIAASVRIGGLLASAGEHLLERLTIYGDNVGLAFQIIDDLLDVTGDSEKIGKPKGSDEKKKKMTYPRLYGIEASRRTARELIEGAIRALEVFDGRAEPLREIARYSLRREC